MRRLVILAGAVLAVSACQNNEVTAPTSISTPTNLTYQLIPSGDPNTPVGIQLRWDPVTDANLAAYVVYSRPTSASSWNLRAQTTTPGFLDLGVPDSQYYVAAQATSGVVSAPSNVVVVDNTNQLPSPAGLVSIALNQAVQLSWSSNARGANPGAFSYYRVYSAAYDLDNNLCDSTWYLEGTTVSEDFIASGYPNGQPLCFTVSAISVDGHESQWPTPVTATPRYDARNVLIFSSQDSIAKSGFSFFVSNGPAYGVVLPGNRTDIDFRIDRHVDGTLWIVPVRTGTSVTLFADQPIDDLTSISLAPESGYSTSPIQAQPGFGYVFETTLGDGLHFAGLRVTAVGSDYVIFDWSYQTDPGNPELNRVSGPPVIKR